MLSSHFSDKVYTSPSNQTTTTSVFQRAVRKSSFERKLECSIETIFQQSDLVNRKSVECEIGNFKNSSVTPVIHLSTKLAAKYAIHTYIVIVDKQCYSYQDIIITV